ncbi:hypothetical protein AAVH_22838 [Aphelenchoides avenae]|nr:hypothetical protein AAVH_22838 [Aphelenchus avenae]
MLAGAEPTRLKLAIYIVVVAFPVLSLLTFLASYGAVYATRVEQGGEYIKWSLNCSASSPTVTFWSWTLQCTHEPISSADADELIRSALQGIEYRSFINGTCAADKRILSDVQSYYLGGYSMHCDLLNTYKTDQAEHTHLDLLAFWLVLWAWDSVMYPGLYDEHCRNKSGINHRQIFLTYGQAASQSQKCFKLCVCTTIGKDYATVPAAEPQA